MKYSIKDLTVHLLIYYHHHYYIPRTLILDVHLSNSWNWAHLAVLKVCATFFVAIKQNKYLNKATAATHGPPWRWCVEFGLGWRQTPDLSYRPVQHVTKTLVFDSLGKRPGCPVWPWTVVKETNVGRRQEAKCSRLSDHRRSCVRRK